MILSSLLSSLLFSFICLISFFRYASFTRVALDNAKFGSGEAVRITEIALVLNPVSFIFGPEPGLFR